MAGQSHGRYPHKGSGTLKYFDFNPFGTRSIILKFNCISCGSPIESDEIYFPSPNYGAETSSDSQIEDEGYAICEDCEKEYVVDIYVTYSGASGAIDDLPDDHSVLVEEISESIDDSELYWEISSTKQLEIFEDHLVSVDKLLEYNFDERTQFSLLVMLHAHIVAATESFLSSIFIHEVTQSDELTRKLIETDPEFASRKITLREIYQEHEKLKITVAIYLKSLIFHRLEKIKPMYKEVFGFDFGDISWLFQAINKRHDCAHRAGYDKEGNKILVTVDGVKELMGKCNDLVQAIDSHVLKSKA